MKRTKLDLGGKYAGQVCDLSLRFRGLSHSKPSRTQETANLFSDAMYVVHAGRAGTWLFPLVGWLDLK